MVAWHVFGHMSDAFASTATDDSVRAVVYAGTGQSFCAGGDFVGILHHALLSPKPALIPGTLRTRIATVNEAMFEMFLGFPNPLVAAVNGPVRCSRRVRAGFLLDALCTARRAPRGLLKRRLPCPLRRRCGEPMRMPEDGWKPTASDALAFGFVDEVVDNEPIDGDGGEERALILAAGARATALADAGTARRYQGKSLAQMRAVNAAESRAVANAFVPTHFIDKAI